MCYYNGCKVSRAEFIRLMGIEKEIRNLKLNRPAQNGFDYRDWPIIKPISGVKDFEIKNVHWEYIPETVYDDIQLKEARKRYTWLNAKGENLFVNERGQMSMYREGALHGRCLAITSGFYEWRHIPMIGKKGQELKATEKIPYHIGVANAQEYFFIAGVSRVWTNESRGQSADTFAIVTTKANDLMEQIHNTKKRMPVILPENLAYEWLFGDLDQKRITELANYRYDSEEMFAYTVDKNFLKTENPMLEVDYPDLLPLL
jgi:putative SOS response-associated peptidase YedK